MVPLQLKTGTLAYAGQRGVVQYTGSKDTHANAGNKIVLRINQPGEMNNILPGWELAGMPDMSTYAPGVKGVALAVGPDGSWQAGRVGDLHDLDAVAGIARRRGRPTATLPPAIAAALPGYATRNDPAAPGSGATVLTLPASRPGHHHDQASATGGRASSAVARLADLGDDVQARLAGMPEPPAEPTSLTALIAARNAVNAAEDNDPEANRAIPVPSTIANPVLSLLDERGDAGARRDEIVAELSRPEGSVKRWLAIMRDHGLITANGSTRAARYHLPEHAPDADDDASADDDAA